MEPNIIINRKDCKGTIIIEYTHYADGTSYVWVNFRGPRDGYQDGQCLSAGTLKEFAAALAEAGKVDVASRKSITNFYSSLHFSLAKQICMWLANAEELSVALMVVAEKCSKVKKHA